MDYIKKLKNHVFYKGKTIPETLFDPYKLVRHDTAWLCDENSYMDFVNEDTHPLVRICLTKKENNEWYCTSGTIGICEDRISPFKKQELAAYTLQSLNIIDENKIKIITNKHYKKDYGTKKDGYFDVDFKNTIWIPRYDTDKGDILKFK